MRREIYSFNYLILSNVSMKIMLYYMVCTYYVNSYTYMIYGLIFVFLKMSFYPFSYIIERLIIYISFEVFILITILSKWILVMWIERLYFSGYIEGFILYNLLIIGWLIRGIYILKIIWWYLILLSSCWFMLTIGFTYSSSLIRFIYFWSSIIEFYGIYILCCELDYMIDLYISREKFIFGIILLSMIGLPPLIGFFTKWWILCINSSLLRIFIGLLGTIICSYITIRLISYNIGYISIKGRTDIIIVGWYCLIGFEIIYNLIWLL